MRVAGAELSHSGVGAGDGAQERVWSHSAWLGGKRGDLTLVTFMAKKFLPIDDLQGPWD